ncbi:MAG: ABC transporter permease [Spirochaetales bacterium]|nr:ABC transporter permease [Spirochaetales bacterium]
MVFLLLPLFVLVTQSIGHSSFSEWQKGALEPLKVSLASSLTAMAIMVIGGTPLAWWISQRRSALARFVEYLLTIPLLMPPLVVGLLLVFLYGPYSFLGIWMAKVGLSASNSFFALVLAELYEASPYYLFAAISAFDSVDRALIHTSYSLGLAPVATFRRVTLPLATPGLAVAFSMAWSRAIGAFGAVIIIAYYPRGLPVAIWVALEERGLPSALPLALTLMLIALPLPLLSLLWRKNRVVYRH